MLIAILGSAAWDFIKCRLLSFAQKASEWLDHQAVRVRARVSGIPVMNVTN